MVRGGGGVRKGVGVPPVGVGVVVVSSSFSLPPLTLVAAVVGVNSPSVPPLVDALSGNNNPLCVGLADVGLVDGDDEFDIFGIAGIVLD